MPTQPTPTPEPPGEPALARAQGWIRERLEFAESGSDVIVALFRTLLVVIVLFAPSLAGDSQNRRFYLGVGAAGLYALAILIWLSRKGSVRVLRPLILVVDTILLAAVVQLGGSLQGGLFGLFYLAVIVGSMWFGAVGSIGAAAIATLCSLVYIMLDAGLLPGDRLAQIQRLMAPHVELLFLAAFLSGYLAETWRGAQRRAEEQQVILDQFRQQMDMARELQTLVLPPELPRVPGLEIGVRARQAAVVVGGDYYDAVAFSDGALGVCSADVSGKSVPGQLRLPLVKYAFRVCALQFRQPEQVMPRLANILYRELPDEMFVTMAYAVIEPRRDRLKLCRAGHCPPLKLVAATGAVEQLYEPGGIAFGIEPDMPYEVGRIPFLPEDYLVFYTDGAIEALDRRGRELEVDGLAELLAQSAPESAQDLANWLFAELERYEEGAKRDDLTIIVVRRTAAG